MTRILLHPQLLPAGSGRVSLPPPWRWWRLKLYPCPDGRMYHERWDDHTSPTEYSIMFDLLEMDEIHDPPALHLTTMLPEIDTIHGLGSDYTLMTRGHTTTCDVVWHERPGRKWHALPGTTCHPGDYTIIQMDRSHRDDEPDDATVSIHNPGLPALRWQLGDTSAEAADMRRIAAAFGVPGAMVGRVPQPSTRLEDRLEEILRLRAEYVVQNYDPPSIILMNPQDLVELRRAAHRSELEEIRRALTSRTGQGRQSQPYDVIFGMELRPERTMPRGQMLVLGSQVRSLVNFGDPMRETWGNSSLGLFQQRNSRELWGALMSPNEIRELEGYARPPAATPRSPAVLPESEIVDEIDRLVNESLTPGPRDDYNINRYPKCTHCGHDWHGVPCDLCTCLGELEDEV